MLVNIVVLLACLSIIIATSITLRRRHYMKIYGHTPRTVNQLSVPATEILKLHRQLPLESRPSSNMVTILDALDVKYGGYKCVNNHFEDNYGGWDGEYTMNWDSHRGCTGPRYCTMKEYRDLKDGLVKIDTALKEQKHKLEITGVAHQLDSVQDVIAQMREEADLIKTITRELTE